MSSAGRQRRIGHSGPPTGDFQLYSSSDNEGSEEEEEEEPVVGAGRISTSSRDEDRDLERNMAAIRLQELYRKRQAEREREEQEMMNVHHPKVKISYKGHRNARTMVSPRWFLGEWERYLNTYNNEE